MYIGDFAAPVYCCEITPSISSVLCSYVTEQPVDEEMAEVLEGTIDCEHKFFQNVRESYLWNPNAHTRWETITQDEWETEEEYRDRVYDEAPYFLQSSGLMTLSEWRHYTERANTYERQMQEETAI